MNWTLVTIFLTMGLFLTMVCLSELGRRIALKRLNRLGEGLAKGIGAVEGAVFALLGLLLAFTFSGAASRFEQRRHLITEEANAIGTAYLRLDLLPDEPRRSMRDLFRHYTEKRSTVYVEMGDPAATKARLEEIAALQAEIWSQAMSACRRSDAQQQVTMLLLPALNQMIDITTEREMASSNHPPQVILWMLFGLSLFGAILVGYAMAENRLRSWLHVLAFAAVVSLTVYVILDMEYPRLGLIRVSAADQVLVDLSRSMR